MGSDREGDVGHGAGKAVEEKTIFYSAKHGFRLRAQKNNMRGQEDTVGPVIVSTLEQNIELDGTKLQGVIQVKCPQRRRDFFTPWLCDFRVRGNDNCEPVMDEYGHVRYEVRTCCSGVVQRYYNSSSALAVSAYRQYIYFYVYIYIYMCIYTYMNMSHKRSVRHQRACDNAYLCLKGCESEYLARKCMKSRKAAQ